jgi:hypothetical protein
MSLASAAALRSGAAGKFKELEKVKVKTSAGCVDITVSRRDTVGDVKRRCEELQKLEPGAMNEECLVFAGRQLDDGHTLGECGLYEGVMLTVYKPSAWSTHLKGYKYKALQYWDRSTVQANRQLKTKPAKPTATAAETETETEPAVDKLAVAAAEAYKKSLARMLQRQVHAELSKRHISARAAFSAFVSCEQDQVPTPPNESPSLATQFAFDCTRD